MPQNSWILRLFRRRADDAQPEGDLEEGEDGYARCRQAVARAGFEDFAEVLAIGLRTPWIRALAARNGRVEALDASGPTLPYAGGRFDAVILGPAAAVPRTELNRVLAPGGQIHALPPAAGQPAPPPFAGQADRLIGALMDNTLGRRSYDYRSGVLDHLQPRPVHDQGLNTEAERIERVRLALQGLDRGRTLSTMFDRITNGARSEIERFERVVCFAQLHFFHHFAGQALRPDGIMVMDPLENFVLRHARCGASARWMVDVMEAGGAEGRLRASGCHTYAEILVDGTWRIADANLYPPGVLPRGPGGLPITLSEAIDEPARLDRVANLVNHERGALDAIYRHYPELREAIHSYRDAPYLASSCYFGDAWSSDGAVTVYTFHKRAASAQLDPFDYGWRDYVTETDAAPASPTLQRPQQISGLCIKDDFLHWDAGASGVGVGPSLYRVAASVRSRNWSYAAIPVGCRFDVPGPVVETSETRLDLDCLPAGTRFVSVMASAQGLVPDAFCLPSDELELDVARR